MDASPFVVARDDIRAITEIEIQGRTHSLGEHRDFRRHEALARFLPSAGRIALSWTRLTAGQELAVHAHPTKSMIVITRGRGHLLGDRPRDLCEGDVVAVPAGAPHGFRTDSELTALSIQFEGAGLYEDERAPRATFVDDFGERLLEYQEQRFVRHITQPFFGLLTDGTLAHPERRARLLACLYQWSKAFQRMMFLRQGLTHGVPWEPLFLHHFHEELGHDELLAHEWHTVQQADPAIEACASWFLYRTVAGDNLERLVLTHFVLERSAEVFHRLASKMSSHAYFAAHAGVDESHHRLGRGELQGMTEPTFRRLLHVSGQAWDILELMLERIVKIVDQESYV